MMLYFGLPGAGGVIASVRTMAEGDPIAPPPGAIAMTADEAGDYAAYWWDGEALRMRAPLPYAVDRVRVPADGATPITISGLPAGTEIYVPGLIDPVPVGGGTVEIAAWRPGRYEVMLSAPPYLPATVWVEVTP